MSKFTVYNLQFTVPIAFSAALLSLAFSSFNLEVFIWFGFVPLFFALEKKSKIKAFYISYGCGFLFFALSMYWLIHVTALGWILLSFYQALYFGIFSLVFYYFFTAQRFFLIPSAWVVLEYIRSHLFGGIGWNLLGYSQYKNLALIQIADITGVYGVSFLVMLMNIVVYSVIKMAIKCYSADSKFKIKTSNGFLQDIKSHPVISTVIVLILFGSVLAYGYIKLRTPNSELPTINLKISVVQGNIPQELKWDEEFKRHIMDRYEALTKNASKDKPNLIIWPETAVPGFLNYDDELLKWLKALIKESKAYFLVGAPMVEKEGSDKNYNSALLFSDEGKFIEQYNKLHLVAFGEFIPFEKQAQFLRKLFPISGDFVSGDEFTVFSLRTTPAGGWSASGGNSELRTSFSALICFEDIFPSLVRGFVKRGADFMVNITNDAWFGKSCAAYQHAANSVFRAVENRRPVIRSANTGLSGFIDKTGNIYERVSKNNNDLFMEGIKTAAVEIYKDKKLTFYTKFGDIFIFCCIILIIIGAYRRLGA